MQWLTARWWKRFARQTRRAMMTEMLVVLAIIGILDYFSGFQVRLLPFYAAPIFIVAWFFSRRTAILFALLAGVVSITADYYDADPDLRGWATTWEIIRHLISCLAVAIAGSMLRAKHDSAIARIHLLEHSQRLERQIVGISDAEQRRIGQDLHDGLCQYLAALSCSATLLRDDLHHRKLKKETEAAGELAELLQDAVLQTRDLARGLVPAHLSQVGLVLGLESLAQGVSRLQNIVCRFELRGIARKYDEGVARHLYRIAQEAINNAVRHGKARKILISLETAETTTTLRVADNGTGISNPALEHGGMGLNIMRYRARETGGELQIESSPIDGTVISCTAPTHHEIRQSAAA